MNLPSRYQPTGTTFSGGQGVVGVWKDSALGREVAVKVLATKGMGGSLLDEAALLAAIKSKHVVELFEVGVDKSTAKEYLVMEYVPGSDLDGYLPENRRALYLCLFQIACGLADIHAVNCLHRDIKPLNMRYDASGIIKIIDFGIGSSSNPVVTKSGRGTDGYRAPEYDGMPTKLTAAVDVYAFGVTAFQFCFRKLDPALQLWPPQRPPSFANATIGAAAATLDPQVIDVLDRCFSSNPDGRPTSAELKSIFGKHLLRGKHVASFVHNGTTYSLSQNSQRYRIAGTKGSFDVVYNGLDFVLSQITGQVFVNGLAATVGMQLPGSCVIIIGAGSGADRDFIPFNVSHPEVVL